MELIKSEAKFRNLAMKAGAGLLLLQGSSFVVEMANEAYLKIVGKTEEEYVGKEFFSLLPAADNDLQACLLNVLKTGITYTINELPSTVNRSGKIETTYLNFVYRACIENGVISGIICVLNDVTDLVNAKFVLAENERQFQNMVMQSPLAMVVFRGKDFVIETVNTQMLAKVWQKKREEVIEKTLLEAFPEMEGQKYLGILTSVFNSGKPFQDTESPVELVSDNKKNLFYLEISYSPLFNIDKSVSGIIVTANDVTRNVQTRIRLDKEETRLQLSTEGTGLATWDLDFKTDRIIHSPKLADIFGFPASKVITRMEILHYIHPDDKSIVDEAYSISFITGIYAFDARIVRQDKTVHWIRLQGTVQFDNGNLPYKMIGTTLDITKEKEKDDYILQLAAIVASSADAIMSINLEGHITTWNDAAVGMFGYTAAEMIGKHNSVLLPDQAITELDMRLKNEWGAGTYSIETKRIKKDNTVIEISFNISPIKDKNGNIIGMSKIGRDITKQKKIQNEIITSEARFRLLANAMPQIIWTSDKNGSINYFNQAVYDFSGMGIAELQGNHWIDLIHVEDKEENIKKWDIAIANGNEFSIEHRFRRRDGEYIWYISKAKPQVDANGDITSWIGTSYDINEIKKNDQNKDFFISMASHELNTPVTTIKGYVEMLTMEYENTQDCFLRDSLSSIHKQIVTITMLIGDLLDLSKIKNGSLTLNRQYFYIDEVIDEVIKEFKIIQPDYTLNFLDHSESILVFADRGRIKQVLVNFFTNAIKYSSQNKIIEITYKLLADEVTIIVKDLGIGISKINQEKIFQRFFRVSGKNEKTYPGFGIGLFIAAEIIERHNGQIWVESELGKGSVFSFSLPLHKKNNT